MRTSGPDHVPFRAALGARLRAEDGSLLIEAMVTAVLVAVVAAGMFTAFNGASATSGTDRERALANNVAQQDQERMRSFRAVSLSNYRETRTQLVANVRFNVVSRADWVTDSSGSASCTGSPRADYLKISSAVTWPGNTARPITITSLVAPPNGSFGTNQGTLAVSVVDPAGNPLSGRTVQLSGPQSMSDVTNSAGCVLWGYLLADDYTASLPGSNCIDRRGNNPPSVNASVIGEATTTVTLECGTAASRSISFDSDLSRRSPSGGTVASAALWASAGHSNLDPPFFRTFGDWTTLKNTISATSLFPFSSAYSFYAGNCDAARANWPGGSGVPANTGTLVTQVVGGGSSGSVTVRQPALNVRVRSSSTGSNVSGARVRVTAESPGCGGTWTLAGSAGNQTTGANGMLADPGVPYGRYDICVDKNISGNRRATLSNVDVNRPDGTATLDVVLNSSSSSGLCP